MKSTRQMEKSHQPRPHTRLCARYVFSIVCMGSGTDQKK